MNAGYTVGRPGFSFKLHYINFSHPHVIAQTLNLILLLIFLNCDDLIYISIFPNSAVSSLKKRVSVSYSSQKLLGVVEVMFVTAYM